MNLILILNTFGNSFKLFFHFQNWHSIKILYKVGTYSILVAINMLISEAKHFPLIVSAFPLLSLCECAQEQMKIVVSLSFLSFPLSANHGQM